AQGRGRRTHPGQGLRRHPPRGSQRHRDPKGPQPPRRIQSGGV
ncbi:MAG: Flagellar motor rotation protein MotB, partial [uncultured Cytophagales bacterium]